MVKTWANVEKTFQDTGINYQLRDWVYLCQIEGRQFYYSPQTGKWRLKGKRAWQFSQTPVDFIAGAKKYSPPENKSNQSEYRQQKTEKKSSRKKTKKTKQKTNTSNSSNQKRQTTSVDEIRDEFLSEFGQYLQQQRERGYKIGWIWHSLLKQFVPTPLEICWLCVVFNYSPGWAFYRIKDIYFQVDAKQIFTTIEENQDDWLRYFYNRWGVQEERQQKREHQTRTTNQSAGGYSSIYQSYLELLKVNFPFTKQELKSAYRKKALETHPDGGGTAEAFRQVHTAYQVLSHLP
jgi:hypothetical protein